MRSIFLTYLCGIVFTIAFTSCEKDTHIVYKDLPVYFQHECINSAFITEHEGWLIDENGNVKYYNLPADWKEPDSEGFISEEDLLSNLNKADSFLYELAVVHLIDMIDLTNEIDENLLTNQNSHTADAGTASLYYYVWDNNVGKYNRKLIWSRGDVSQINQDHHAQQLLFWLVSVGFEAGYFKQPG